MTHPGSCIRAAAAGCSQSVAPHVAGLICSKPAGHALIMEGIAVVALLQDVLQQSVNVLAMAIASSLHITQSLCPELAMPFT